MLASELAQELEIDPSLMSKRLGAYFMEIGEPKPRLLDAQACEHLRHVQVLLSNGKARNFLQGVQMVLGTYAEPVPPESAQRLEKRLEQIETVQADLLDKVTRMLSHMEAEIARRANRGSSTIP